jgi:hypothetical protein
MVTSIVNQPYGYVLMLDRALTRTLPAPKVGARLMRMILKNQCD